MPSSRQARITRTAISPRLAIRTLANTDRMFTAVPGDNAKRSLAGAPFGDVHWVDETGSTNADVLALARAGAPQGYVLVADHQTGGRGRAGRTWVAPRGGGLLLRVRPAPPRGSRWLHPWGWAWARSTRSGR